MEPQPESMTPSTAQVVELLTALAEGLSVADAARRSSLSTATARRRLADLRTQWNCPNNLALIVAAVRHDLI